MTPTPVTRAKRFSRIQSKDLQTRYILSALYPRGNLSPDAHQKLLNKLKDMGS